MSPKPPVPSGNSEENVIHLGRSKVQGLWCLQLASLDHNQNWGHGNLGRISSSTKAASILQAALVSATGFVSRGGAEALALKTGSSNTFVQTAKREMLQVSSQCFNNSSRETELFWHGSHWKGPCLLDVEVCHRVLHLQDCKGNDFVKHQSLMIRLKGDYHKIPPQVPLQCAKKTHNLLISLRIWTWPKLLVKTSHSRGLLLHFHQACNNRGRRHLVSWWSCHSTNRTQFFSQWKR